MNCCRRWPCRHLHRLSEKSIVCVIICLLCFRQLVLPGFQVCFCILNIAVSGRLVVQRIDVVLLTGREERFRFFLLDHLVDRCHHFVIFLDNSVLVVDLDSKRLRKLSGDCLCAFFIALLYATICIDDAIQFIDQLFFCVILLVNLSNCALVCFVLPFDLVRDVAYTIMELLLLVGQFCRFVVRFLCPDCHHCKSRRCCCHCNTNRKQDRIGRRHRRDLGDALADCGCNRTETCHNLSDRGDHLSGDQKCGTDCRHNASNANDLILFGIAHVIECVDRILYLFDHRREILCHKPPERCHQYIKRRFQFLDRSTESTHHSISHVLSGSGAILQAAGKIVHIARSRVDQRQPVGHLILAKNSGCRRDLFLLG